MRKAFLSVYQLGHLHGLSEGFKAVIKTSSQENTKGSVDLERVFFVAAYQAGVDRFIVPPGNPNGILQSSFMKQRTDFRLPKHFLNYYQAVHKAFDVCLPAGWERKEELLEAVKAKYFLVDLLCAMSMRTPLLCSSGLPNVSELEKQLPGDFGMLITALFSRIKTVETAGAIPRYEVLSHDVQRFEDIMTGGLYHGYAVAHSALDDASQPLEAALRAVEQSAGEIVKYNNRSLGLHRLAVSSLQITPKLLETVFPKFMSVLSEPLSKLGVEFLEARRRLTIFDLNSTMTKVFRDEIRRGSSPEMGSLPAS